MPWMLMTESPPHAPARIEPRSVPRAAAGNGGSAAPSGNGAGRAPVAHEARLGGRAAFAPHGCDAWILFGDIERALLQAGMLEILIGALPAPAYIYASGPSVANAMLATGGGADAIARGWEALRAAHFLVPAALLRIPTLRWTQALTSRLSRILAETVAKGVSPRKTTNLQIMTADGLNQAFGRSGRIHMPRLRDTLARDDNVPVSLATAISAATNAGVERIYLFASDARLRRHPTVASASSRMSTPSPQLEFVVAESADVPGALSYWLPGSGGPERLMRDGRIAAQNWLERDARTRIEPGP